MRFRFPAAFAMIFLLMSLCGCKTNKVVYTLTPFSQMAVIEMPGGNFSGKLTFENKDLISFELTKPKEISGMCYYLQNGKESVKYETLEFSPENNDGCIFTMLSILRDMADTSFEIEIQEESIVSTESDGKKYELVFDSVKNKLIGINSGDYSLKLLSE